MPLPHRLMCALLAGVGLISSAGCLSLGATTYEMDNPKTTSRIMALETRVGVLERAVSGEPVPAQPLSAQMQPLPAYPIPGPN